MDSVRIDQLESRLAAVEEMLKGKGDGKGDVGSRQLKNKGKEQRRETHVGLICL